MIIGFDAKRAFHNSSGLGNYSRDIIRILSTQFPEHRYLLYNPKQSEKNRFQLKDNIEIKLPQNTFWKLFSSAWRQGPVSKQISADQVDIFHGLSGEIPRGIDRQNTKVVVSIHDLIFMRFPELYKTIDRRIYFNKFKYAAEKSDLIIAISGQTKRDVIRLLNVDENKVQVHYQGCHPAFKPRYTDGDKANVRNKFSLPDRFILNVGTIEPRKNVLAVIEAIRSTPYHLVIVGRATVYKKKILAYIQQNNMHNRVHFPQVSAMNELAMIYQMADLFCYPSVFEGFGIPIIEALFSGTPVIASSEGCFPEAGGPDSLYLGIHKAKDWEDAIEDLMHNPERRQKMAESGIRYAQQFTDENVGAALMKIYQSLKKY